jgi:outer membrane protein OmpA-like peptidoglycan-associated protein
VIALIAIIAGGTWWFGRDGSTADQASTKPNKPGHSASQGHTPTNKPSGSTTPSKPVTSKTTKPTVTLNSDLAFAKNSAALSTAAKAKVAKLARQIKAARLRGTVHINGYTDSLGSAAHGLTLSQDRAQAVAQYLRSQLGGYQIPIVAVGHGEDDPIASNDTEAGRQQNRRVTITLPEK